MVKNIFIGISLLELVLLVFFLLRGRGERARLQGKIREVEEEDRRHREEMKNLRHEGSKLKKELETAKSQLMKFGSRMIILKNTADAMVSTFDRDQILDALMDTLEKNFDVSAGFFLAYDKSSETLKAEKGIGIEPEVLAGIVNRIDEGIVGRAMEDGNLISELDYELDYNLKETFQQSENPVILAIPLKRGEEKIGLIGVKEFSRRDFSETDARFLALMANFVTLALKNANLFLTVRMQSITDGLTKLYNHRYLQQFLRKELDRSRRYGAKCSVILTDIDHFKNFNDVYGHQAGDFVLAQTAAVVKRTIREVDLAARYGGEEFCVVFPEIEKDKAFIAAERVRKAIEAADYDWDGQILKVTTSIGVACFPEDAENETELVKKADAALYIAKETGRNKTVLSGDSE
jgi:diguanylate cyclase (GGDEF)-like protein